MPISSFVDSKNIISGSTRNVTSRESGFRAITPGIPYQPPPSRDFPDISSASSDTLKNLLAACDEPVLKGLTSLAGGSKLFAGEVLALIGVSPDTPISSLKPEILDNVLATAARLAPNHSSTAVRAAPW